MISCHKESVPFSRHFKIVWYTAKYMAFYIFWSSDAFYSRSENEFLLKFHVVLVISLINCAKWRASYHKQELLTLHEHLFLMGYMLLIFLVFCVQYDYRIEKLSFRLYYRLYFCRNLSVYILNFM